MSRHSAATPAHLRHQTQLSRTGEMNMHNRKPFRTARQRELARKDARVVDGRFVSDVPVSMHGKGGRHDAGEPTRQPRAGQHNSSN